MEPRVVVGRNVTCWDIRLTPPGKVSEAKLKPKREEVIEWLDRVESGIKQKTDLHFELMYSRGAIPLISALERLCRLAKEAGGIRETFGNLVGLESNPDVQFILGHLRSDPHLSLLRVNIAPFDSTGLQQMIQFFLRHLVREQDRSRLYDFLFSKFHKGIEQRLTYRVRELMREAMASSITFFPPPAFETRDLASEVAGALFILQGCELGLPDSVLAAGIASGIEELNHALSQYLGGGLLSHDNGLWAVARFRPPLAHEEASALHERTLRHLLEFIASNKQNPLGWQQVPNAIALAKACQTGHPEMVSTVFMKLDKLLKRKGNKRLVLEVANLSIAAAHRHPRTELQAKAEAVALVCGRSWVYQRSGRLEEARAEGEKSLRLGKEIGWDRNTVYCLKCIGRLFRMEAESKGHDGASFAGLVQSSVTHLKQAITLFPQVSELSASQRTAEVGDCFSLLARTFLVARDMKKANEAAREAIQNVTDKTSKDYADLQILLGDLETGDKSAAESYYDGAIRAAGTDDAEKSEVAARAWFRKGLLTRAQYCFERAAGIWDELEEDWNADKARWEGMLLQGQIPTSAIHVIGNESPSVRIEVMRLHESLMAGMPARNRGRRSEPDKKYWLGLIPDAVRNVAVRHRDW